MVNNIRNFASSADCRALRLPDCDDLGRDAAVGEAHCRNGGGQAKALWAGAAWVQVQHGLALLALGLMSVAADHGGKAGGGGVEIELLQIMQHVKRQAAQFNDLGFRQKIGPGTVVDVARSEEHTS